MGGVKKLAGSFVIALVVVLGAALDVLVLNQESASAHGGVQQLDTGVSAPVALSVYLVLSLITVVGSIRWLRTPEPTALNLGGDGAKPASGYEQAESAKPPRWKSLWGKLQRGKLLRVRQVEVQMLLSALVLAQLLLLLVVAIQGNDPFGSVGRSLFILWFGLLMISPLVGNVWSFVSPTAAISKALGRDRVSIVGADSAALLPVCTVIVVEWFFLAYDKPKSLGACALMLAAYALVVIGRLARVDPVSEALEGISKGSRFRVSGVLVVLLGGITFAIFKNTTVWSSLTGPPYGWKYVVASSVALAICVGLVRFLLLIISWGSIWNKGVQGNRFLVVYSPPLIALFWGLVVANHVGEWLTAIQNQLFVLWDPFDRGWSVFGETQGISVQLAGQWIDCLRLAVLLGSPLLAVVLTARQARYEHVPVASALPLLIAMPIAGYAALKYVGGY